MQFDPRRMGRSRRRPSGTRRGRKRGARRTTDRPLRVGRRNCRVLDGWVRRLGTATANHGVRAVTQWIEVTWTEVMEGDHVRMVGQPASEAMVKTISDPWRGHAKYETKISQRTGKPYDIIEAHEHVDIFVTLEGRAGQLKFAP